MIRKGTLITAPIRIQDDSIAYPSAYANEICGGIHSGDTLFLRDSLPVFYRAWGMMFTVNDDGANTGHYQLIYGKTNTNLSDNNNWLKLVGGAPNVDVTLSGDGSIGTPLKIAQQGAIHGGVLIWDSVESAWRPFNKIIINGYVGNYRETGRLSTITGIADASAVVTCDDFINTFVKVMRGGFDVSPIDDGGGGSFFTKNVINNFITFSDTLSIGERFSIETFPAFI